jgi:hypothetical protein
MTHSGGKIMTAKMKLKMTADILMTALLPVLMAFQVTGQTLHEYLGAAMILLFVIHNALNARWYGSLLKGKYTPVRLFQTLLNLALLCVVILLAWSGIVMSDSAFSFLHLQAAGMSRARLVHLCCAYWGFVLMSAHIGLHWGLAAAAARQAAGAEEIRPAAVLRVFGAAAALYGAVCFYRQNILSYMFLTVQFAFLDFDKNAALVFIENAAMMVFWGGAAFYAAKALARTGRHSLQKKEC